MRIGIARRNVRLVELEGCLAQRVRNRAALGEFGEQIGDGVPPRLRPHPLEDGFDGLLSRLLGREAGPIVVAALDVAPGMLECGMKTAAVSKLKATLSQYLAQVKAGEEIIVTERGRPVAKIVPLSRGETVSSHLLELAHAGLVRLGSGRLPAHFWKMPRPVDRRGAALKALLKERTEGR
jgi:prevent-host-death family protein